MQEMFKLWTTLLAAGIEAGAALVIGIAALEAIGASLLLFLKRLSELNAKEHVRLRLGRWLALSLEFELAADILRTAIAPIWNETPAPPRRAAGRPGNFPAVRNLQVSTVANRRLRGSAMLRSAASLEGFAIQATDGTIGTVSQFFFDDQRWTLRYFVVRTGGWLRRRRVLISPLALRGVDTDAKSLRVSITCEQVERSPDIDADKPVSRQMEARYHDHYRWPYYWSGPRAWGIATNPVGMLEGPYRVNPPPVLDSACEAPAIPAFNDGNQKGDQHLRSSKDVRGYGIAATDTDFSLAGGNSEILPEGQPGWIANLLIDGHPVFERMGNRNERRFDANHAPTLDASFFHVVDERRQPHHLRARAAHMTQVPVEADLHGLDGAKMRSINAERVHRQRGITEENNRKVHPMLRGGQDLLP